jgi:hypothetical protein
MTNINEYLKNIKQNPNDVVYTPKSVALDMIEKCNIKKNMKILDPCKGLGVFYDNLPDYCIKDYCEIEENKDFFDYNEKVDLIIGNPPFSIWDSWLEKTCKLTDKFCYIFGFWNLTLKRLNKIKEKGFGITYFKIVDINWWFRESYIIIFEKNKESVIDIEKNTVVCDICNKKCRRGTKTTKKKYGMNECSNV